MTTEHEKEINRLKQSRRNAYLNLTAKRAGFSSWSNFGKQFTEALATLPAGASESQVNAEIETILTAALAAVQLTSKKNTPDADLSDVFEKTPRLRNWVVKKRQPTPPAATSALT